MGDSAGGGLSTSFCEYLAADDVTQTEHLILISPWVDVSMSGDYGEFEEIDSMLGVDGLREMGDVWSGDLDLKVYKVSPLFADMENLPRTTIFVGTHEIFYPDIIKFFNKLNDKGIDVELNIGEGMSHVYPLHLMVVESKEAFKHIILD